MVFIKQTITLINKKVYYLLQRKILFVTLIIIILLVLFFEKITNKLYFYLEKSYDLQSSELSEMINSVIGIPYHQKPQYRNDSPDIIRFSKDEWLALPYYESATEVDLIEDKFNLVDFMSSKEEATHADSISIIPIWGAEPYNGIYHQLCDYFLTCKSLNISVQEYVLQKPEILQNIIKIAERPCDYIRTIDEVKVGDEIIFNSSYESRGKIFRPQKFEKEDIKTGIKLARQALGCDRKNKFTFPLIFHPSICSRKFVLLVINKKGIVTYKPEKSLNIIIERKDID